MTNAWLDPALMGLVEGITEFLPVSSTGHMILAQQLLGWQGVTGKVFEVVIQLGAILAVSVLYFRRLFNVVIDLPSKKSAQNFTLAVLVAFLPAAVVGFLAHDYIAAVLFNPLVVSWALLLGGIAIIVIERFFDPVDKYNEVEEFTPMLAFKIGVIQLLALIPGVSRSGATIMGATLLGASRKSSAEFSFFLAIPVMVGASALTLYKNWHELTDADFQAIAIGFAVAFISALIVVDLFVKFVSRNGFTPFGWYRVIIGATMLVYLS
ncbi:MAG TPA: undecaprenyl-diphosphate phosphatase [Alphaproteobacteria bacterium]|nr:undecaprenyl-diphosphate phosphatase [Alphaproteobacteria bacterium]